MGTLRNIVILLLLSILSCEPSDNTPYYNFNSYRLQFIPTNYNEIGKTISFKSQSGAEIKLQVISYNVRKRNGGGMSFTQDPSEFHYYDEAEIELEFLDENSTNCKSAYINAIGRNYGVFLFIDLHRATYPCNGYERLRERIEPPYNTTTMTVNNRTYHQVLTLFEGEEFIKFSDGYSINRVYYDMKHGFIGFDDTERNIAFRIEH